MEYFVGSVITLITIVIVRRFSKNNLQLFKEKEIKFRYSQSRAYEIMKPIMPLINIFLPKLEIVSQSTVYKKKHSIRVMVMNNYAYWIKDNSVWRANIDGQEILKETAQKVDTMGMSKVELDEMMFIVDKLTKGESDDNSNPRK